MDVVSVPWLNTECGVFSLLLRGKSGPLWSAHLVYPLTQWLGAAVGAGCARVLPVSLGGFSKNFLFYVLCCRVVRTWKSGLAFALVSFSPSGVCVLPVEYVSSGRVRCLVQQWIHVLWEVLDEFQHFLRCGELES